MKATVCKRQSGQAMAEYVITAALLIAVIIGVLGLFGKTLGSVFHYTAATRSGPAGVYP